jgi:anti-anti-sigma regulatory factor
MTSRILARSKTFAAPKGSDSQSQQAFEEIPGIGAALCWHPVGSFSAEGCLAFDKEIRSAELKEYLLVDFSRIDAIDPVGIGFLISLHKRMRAQRGELILFGLRPKMLRFMETLGFGEFFSIAVDQRYAIEYILEVKRDIFPLTAACPACSSLLELRDSGRSRCKACGAVITVRSEGAIELG